MTIHWDGLFEYIASIGVKNAMDEANRRIVSNERIDLIKAYEREVTYRGRAVAANRLWLSLSPHSRNEICQRQGHHPGFWLQEQLAASDAKLGLPELTPTSRNSLRVLLLQEDRVMGQPGRDVSPVWKWLDQGELRASQLKLLFTRVGEMMQVPGADWEKCLARGKELARAGRNAGKLMREGSFSQAPPATAPSPDRRARGTKAPSTVRGTVEKTLQFQAFKKVLDEAPDPRSLPIPAGVDAATYREAYSEMLENIRVVLELAGRDFGNAKRRYRSTEISFKAGALAKACRTLRVTVPPPGQPVDEFSARRKWLEIVKAYHPDKNAGDASKVEVFDAANKAFETIKEYNRKLSDRKSEETTNVDSEQQGAAQS
jgi:hypothetical protein